MTAPRSSKLIEIDVDSYLEQRISELALPTSITDLRSSALTFEKAIGWVNSQANSLSVLGACALFAAGGTAIVARSPLSLMLIVLIIVVGTLGFALLAGGFRRRNWSHYIGRKGLRRLRCDAQLSLNEILEEVNSGHHTIMRIAEGGMGTSATPVSHLSADLIISSGCLTRPWLAAELFGNNNIHRQFVVVMPEAPGEWFNYYLWNAPVANQLLRLFELTPEIYAGDNIKRLKVGIALREIRDFVNTRKSLGKSAMRKDVVVTAFQTALKLEATRLRAEGGIDNLEELQLCRLNITGEAASYDTAETGGNRGRKPESWFLNLMSGQYAPVTRPLSETVRCELNVSPGFIS